MANISTEHLHFSLPAYPGINICLKTHTARVGKYNFQKGIGLRCNNVQMWSILLPFINLRLLTH